MFMFQVSAISGTYKTLVPGVSSRIDVENILGKPVKEIRQGQYYEYLSVGHDLKSLLVKFDEKGVVCSIQLKFLKTYSQPQVKKWFNLDKPDKSEMDFHGFRNDTYLNKGLILHFEGSGEDGNVAGLSHIPVSVKKASGSTSIDVAGTAVVNDTPKPVPPEKINWLGVLLAAKQTHKVEVIRPFSGSPADRAGLSPGDIIVEFGRSDLSGKGPEDFNSIVESLSAEKPHPMVVSRMGKNVRLTVTLENLTLSEISALRDSQKKQARKNYDLGKKLKDQNNYAEAIPFYLKALRLDPEKNEHYDDLAICLREEKKRREAYNLLNASMLVKETYFNTYQYGYMIFQDEREKDAIGYFERSTRLLGSGSSWHWPYLRLGQAHYNLKAYQQARTALKEAEKMRPQDADAVYYLCYCCDHLGQKQEAIEYCKRYLAMDTRDSKRNSRIKNKLRALNKRAGVKNNENKLMNGFLKAMDTVTKDINEFNKN